MNLENNFIIFSDVNNLQYDNYKINKVILIYINEYNRF